MSPNLLIMLCKYPTPGQVKTRLAASIWYEKAAETYISFVHKLIVTHSGKDGYDFQIFIKDRSNISWFAELFGISADMLWVQADGDLWSKMSGVYISGKTQWYTNIIVIWSDSPQMTSGHISDAFVQLKSHDYVLWPANDGGYRTIWSRLDDIAPAMLDTYSHEQVYMQTIDHITQSHATYISLPELIDVDNIEDLKAMWWNISK